MSIPVVFGLWENQAWTRRGPLKVKHGLSLWWDCPDLAPEPVAGRNAVVC